jgi:hypothetical protein
MLKTAVQSCQTAGCQQTVKENSGLWAQGRGNWQALVHLAMNWWVTLNVRCFLAAEGKIAS